MSENLKPYPKYKDSGVGWLGQVPEGWEIGRLKDAAAVQTGLTLGKTYKGMETQAYPYLRVANVQHERLDLRDVRYVDVPADEARGCTLRSGDVLMTEGGDIDKLGRGCVWYDEVSNCLHQNHVFAVRCKPAMLLPEFLVALMSSPHGRTYFELTAKQTTNLASTNTTTLRAFPVLLPPLNEQVAMMRFLDRVDRRIRRYIRAKQKLIGLLNEQKQAMILKAVTLGLNPHVRLKPSRVEWLRVVPEHWDILRARYLFRETDERSQTGAETHLSMSQKLGLVPSELVEQRTLISESYVGGKLCDKDDLVLNRLKAHLGVFAIAKQAGVVSPDYTVLRPTRPMVVSYYERILRSPGFRHELRTRAKGIVEGFWRLYTGDFYDISLPFPPLEEQRSIVEAIDAQIAGFDRLANSTESDIALLREYRNRLIAQVVTGKLDVRAAAAALPDEPDEPEDTELLDDDTQTEGEEPEVEPEEA
ncbi:MAG TPA: restriction endonuclease subunit S [Symbiobacteriaceae bacterium]|nr:restriction endonuclease subunit S [Symbiobacteriaceae bacterium]